MLVNQREHPLLVADSSQPESGSWECRTQFWNSAMAKATSAIAIRGLRRGAKNNADEQDRAQPLTTAGTVTGGALHKALTDTAWQQKRKKSTRRISSAHRKRNNYKKRAYMRVCAETFVTNDGFPALIWERRWRRQSTAPSP
ncbi:hypothetical protein MRX96_027354 [Rhipicephalus microplus]